MFSNLFNKQNRELDQNYSSLYKEESICKKSDISLIWSIDLTTTLLDLKHLISRNEKHNKYNLIVLDLTHKAIDTWDPKYNLEEDKTMDFCDAISNPLNHELLLDDELKYFNNFSNIIEILYYLILDNGFLAILVSGSKRHYSKVIVDHHFGLNNFVNEIFIEDSIRNSNFNSIEQTSSIFIYGKDSNSIINPLYKEKANKPTWRTMHSDGQGDSKIFRLDGKEIEIFPPVGNHWKFKQETIDKMCKEGRIRLNSKGNPEYLTKGRPYILDNNWFDIPGFYLDSEGYVTNEKIIERLVGTFSNKEDHILQIFVRNIKSVISSVSLDRKNTFINSLRYEIHKFITTLNDMNLPFDYYSSGLIEKHVLDDYNQIKFILNIIGAQTITNYTQFQGITENLLVSIFPFNQTFDKNDLRRCIEDFNNTKNEFNGFLVLAEDFQRDDMWDQLNNELGTPNIKVYYYDYIEYFKHKNIQIKILKKPIAEVKVIMNGEQITLEISDYYFLNEDIIPSTIKAKLSRLAHFIHFIQHWEIDSFDERNEIVNQFIIRKKYKEEKLKIIFSFPINENVKHIVIKIFDLTGAYSVNKIDLGGIAIGRPIFTISLTS